MRRAALARWLNLSVIAAVIAVLTVVLVSAPTPRVAFAADVCGQASGTPVEDPDMTIDWDANRPTSGPPGTWTGIQVSWEVAPSDFDLIVVWRADEAAFAVPIGTDSWTGNDAGVGIDFNVPADATAGTYSVSACWRADGGTTWNSLDLDTDQYLEFTVEASSAPCYGELPDGAGATLDLFPNEGPYPSTFDAAGSTIESFPGVLIQLIWDWNPPFELNAPLGTVLVEMPVPENTGVVDFLDVAVPAPPLGEVGPHPLGLCYYDGVSWFFVDMNEFGAPAIFTVTPSTPDVDDCLAAADDANLGFSYETISGGSLTSRSGPAGSEETVRLFNSAPDLGGSTTYLIIWDYTGPNPEVIQTWTSDSQDDVNVDITIPFDAEPGTYDIGLCSIFNNDAWVVNVSPSTVEFIVDGYAPCGAEPFTQDTGELVQLVPTSGPTGTSFNATITAGAESALPDASLVQLVWGWVDGNGEGSPPAGTVINQVTKSDTLSTASVAGIVPQTQPGQYFVNICYLVESFVAAAGGLGPALITDGEWYYGVEVPFTVLAPPTSTPTAVPPTATPTATTPPDEPPAPTATFTPTLVPTATATATLVPTATSTPPPTIPVGVATQAAGVPTTPPGAPTTPPGGPGGGGGTGPGGGGTTPLNPNTGAQETTTPGTSTPAPTNTPAPTATRAPTTPTPTPTPTQTTPPSSDIQGSRTEWVASVKSFTDVTDDFDVLLTNALLTGLFLILIFLTSEIFNQTIRDNQTEVENWLRNFFGPVIGIWTGLSALMGVATLGSQKLKDFVWLAIVLVITALIEGFLDPNFGFNKSSLLLFLSLLVAVGFVTYLTEGGEAFVARSFYGEHAAVRVFPAAIGIALICVIMSRLGGFVPGILYGFVGTAVFLRPHSLNAAQNGKMIFFPMAMMLAISVCAWLIVDQFRGPNPSNFDVFMEGVLIGVLIATIEGVAINMLPIAYMDGRKLIDWNPLVWIGTAGVAIFLLWTILLNDERAYFNSLQETTSQVAIFAVLFCFGLSVITWLWFRYRPGGHA